MLLRQKAFKGLLWQFGGTATKAVCQVGLLAVLARLLTPEEFGIVGAALVVVGLSYVISEVGVGPALVQRQILERSHLQVALSISLVASAIVAGGVFLLAPAAETFFNMAGLSAVIKVLCLAFLLQGVAVPAKALLQRELRLRELAVVELVSYVGGYGIVGVSLAVSGFSYWSLVYAYIGQVTCHAAFLIALRPRAGIPGWNGTSARQLLGFGSGFTLGRVFNYAANHGDEVIVARWLGADALGIYGRAYQLLALPAQLVAGVADKVLFPAMSDIQADRGRTASAYRRVVVVVSLFGVPVSVFAVLAAPELVLVLLGEAWSDAIVPFQVLGVAIFFKTGYKICNSLARAIGAVYQEAWRKGVFAALVIIGALVGRNYGVVGVSIGVSMAIIGQFVLMTQLSMRLVGLTLKELFGFYRTGMLHGGVVGLSGGLVIGVGRTLSWDPVVTLAASVGLTMLVLRTLWGIWSSRFICEDTKWVLRVAESTLPSALCRILWPTQLEPI